MYINLSNIPQWVLENSVFLSTLKEDCMNDDENDNYYIPFLDHYDDTFDFSHIFQKNEPYLNLDNYISIYLDIFTFLDFIGFEIPFYKLIIPKDYKHISHILFENNELYNHFVNQIVGVQHYAFHIKEFDHNIKIFDFNVRYYDDDKEIYHIDTYFKESIENDHYDWILWFIKNVNKIQNYERLLYNFDYTNVSTKTFDLLYSVNNKCYVNICEHIVKFRKSELFIKYINEMKNAYNNEALLKIAFKRNINENINTQLEFIKLMLYNGYEFNFIYEYSKCTYFSNNPLLMDYMYTNYKEKIDKNVVDICPVLHRISLKNNICNMDEKKQILNFFIVNYANVIQMEKLLHYTFKIDSNVNNSNKSQYDFDFIQYLIMCTGNMDNIYSYMIYLYFNYNPGIEGYIESCKNKELQSYDILKFRNTFKYVLSYKNVDYVDFYIKNKLYINDQFGENEYLKSVLYDVNLFKLIYNNKIGNIHLTDYLFISAYQNQNAQIILFMLQEKYVPSERIKEMIKNDYTQSVEVNNVEKNGIIEVQKFYTNAEFEYKEKMYNMICT